MHFSTHFCRIDRKVLNVGDELWKETLPLQMGSSLYQLQGLKSYTWYEVKISYPASVCVTSLIVTLSSFSLGKLTSFIECQIPASFSLQLRRSNSDSELNRNRRLLNTEKLIFKTDDLDLLGIQVRL